MEKIVWYSAKFETGMPKAQPINFMRCILEKDLSKQLSKKMFLSIKVASKSIFCIFIENGYLW